MDRIVANIHVQMEWLVSACACLPPGSKLITRITLFIVRHMINPFDL